MRTYRDYLNEKKVPRGPWCVLELNNPLKKPDEPAKLAVDKSA